jgi:glycosyltransferase involved in cell wall biosynthesis
MKKKLVILLASNLDPRGGGRETWIANFLNNEKIVQLYESVIVIGSDVSPSSEAIVFPENVNVIKDRNRVRKYLPGFIYYAFFVRKTLNEVYAPSDSYDVISCGSWAESLALYFSSIFNKSNVTSICWLRSIMIKELARIYPSFILQACEKIECYILNKYAIIIANGSDTSRYYQRLNIKNHIIPNGIHTDHFVMNNCRGIQCQFIGRTSSEKGILYLVDAIHNLHTGSAYNDVYFTVIGDGPNAENVKKLESHVDVLTYKGALNPEEVKRELAVANISFHLTLTKDIGGGGVSHSLLEAMASGQRVVCWDNDIFNQVIGSELFFKAKEGCVKALIEQIKLAVQSTKSDHVEYPRKIIECSKNYDFSAHIEKYCKLI